MNASDFLNSIRIGAQLAVGEQPKCPPWYCAGVVNCCNHRCNQGRDCPERKPKKLPGWIVPAVLGAISTGATMLWIYFNR